MRLLLLHPAVANRSCDDCRKYLYHDKPGQFGDAVTRGGRPVRRPLNTLPPCAYCPKQPPTVPERDRTPLTAEDLSEKNWQAYQHYGECKAVGEFPDDDIVRRNAAIVARAEKAADQITQLNTALLSSSRRG